ncbi:MAG: HAD-IB family phosphatase [Proteobacteria bacterium]|nr:HAD-IB family phosphatase [Pseudomonadota bacterium]
MTKKGMIMSLSAIGLDSPGLVSKITSKVFELKGNVIDVEETCRRGLFSIFLIIDFSASSRSVEEITNALEAIGEETGLKILLGVYDEEEITLQTQKESHVVTVLGEDQPGIIAKVSAFFHRHHINIEHCRMIARGAFFSMEMVIDTSRIVMEEDLSHAEAIERMKGGFKALCGRLNQSVVIQSEDVYRKGKKLIVFDVESTLIQESSLKAFLEKIQGELRSAEMGPELKDVGEDKMKALLQNARLLKGSPISEFERFGENLELNPGALELIGILKSMGFKIALLSSGFNFFVKKIFETAGVDYAFSNNLKVDEKGIITGELEEPVITSATKGEILDFIMHMENIHPEQVIAVGDGSIGSHFISNVGLSIAFKPDEKSIKTDGVLSSDRITSMLYCLGIPKPDLEKYLKEISS